MYQFAISSTNRLLSFQLGAVLVGLVVLYLLPPKRGPVLLVPLTPFANRSLIHEAVDAGALLIAAGPLSATYIVYNDQPGFALGMLKAGILPLAAPPAGCGSIRGRRP